MNAERAEEQQEPIRQPNTLSFQENLRYTPIIPWDCRICTGSLDHFLSGGVFEFLQKGSPHVVETLEFCTAVSIEQQALRFLDFTIDEHLVEVVELDAWIFFGIGWKGDHYQEKGGDHYAKESHAY